MNPFRKTAESKRPGTECLEPDEKIAGKLSPLVTRKVSAQEQAAVTPENVHVYTNQMVWCVGKWIIIFLTS